MTVKIYYLIMIMTTTAVVGWLVVWKLRKLQQQREERLHDQPTPVLSSTDTNKFRKQQIKRMESRFSITRWTVIISILLTGAGFASIPFIKHAPPTLLPLIMGAVSVVIGIAAKPFIENMICGLVLCFSKLARIGDTAMVDDAYGVIEDVTLTHCIIKRWDSLRYVVPNSSMMTKEFVNYSLHDNNRWVIVEFWIDYAADFTLVETLAVETPKKSQYFANKEEPRFWVVETDKEGVKCMVTAWATSPAEGWMLGHDIRKALLPKLQEHHIKTHTYHIDARSSVIEALHHEQQGQDHE